MGNPAPIRLKLVYAQNKAVTLVDKIKTLMAIAKLPVLKREAEMAKCVEQYLEKRPFDPSCLERKERVLCNMCGT